jgi:GNAT superfamily N-acetyltransferase
LTVVAFGSPFTVTITTNNTRMTPVLRRTDSSNTDFIILVRQLDAYLAEKDGSEHSFYAQYNSVATLRNVVIAYHNGIAVCCGAFKPFSEDTVEVKRMYTLPGYRGQGYAAAVLAELERWAAELSYIRCVLETGKRQSEAVLFYPRNGYTLIPNYGQYAGIENSLCFEKLLANV